MESPHWKTVCQFEVPQNVRDRVQTYIYTREMKTCLHKKLYTLMFIVILFIKYKRRKEAKNLTTDGQVNKILCIHKWNIIQS